MIDLASWAWPQITYAILLLLSGGINLAVHGRPKEGKQSFFVWLTSAVIVGTILLFGGFFA